MVVGLGGDEAHAGPEVVLVDERVKSRELGLAVGAAGPADDHQRGGRVPVVVEMGEGSHGNVSTLQALDAADEQQHRAVAQPEHGARGGARAR